MLSSCGDGYLFSTSVFTLPFSLRPRDRFGFSLVSAKRIHEVAVGVRSVLETAGEKDSGVTGSRAPGSLQYVGCRLAMTHGLMYTLWYSTRCLERLCGFILFGIAPSGS